ncbi:hypothetical protein [Lysinibacillus varians]|uniref:Uncharacterized protein n=1 Tax=Lysinibacillus varians TaxID=1145276 RepID=A0ABY2T5Z5_9BACI|nr:hypothetical protein [Lysinibacillus varians]AHN22054.1 hypothetical protein T479_12320 [Lysinibacillus varians]TKI52649.1 hypothetical protein FC752_18870 [Lysinibacillus varians]
MIPAKLEVVVDGQLVKDEVKKQVSSIVYNQLWFVDLEKISELTCMSKRWLEDEIVSNVRMKAIEIKKNRKRWWPAEKAFEVISEITESW